MFLISFFKITDKEKISLIDDLSYDFLTMIVDEVFRTQKRNKHVPRKVKFDYKFFFK